jgi:DNA invertase Pin-like site-specific DNA recombinase
MPKPKTYDFIIRVSELGERDEHQTITIPEQRDKCLAEIERIGGRAGIELNAVDVSGGVVIDSPAYANALTRVQSGETAGIVVAYSSRFARNAWAVGRYLEQLKKADGELWFCDRPGIDYRTPSGAIIVSVDAVMNANYLQETKDKAEHALRHNILVRGIPSKCPFGYRRNEDGPNDPTRDPKALTPNPATAPTVERIFRARADGRSWVDIAAETDLSVPTVRGIVRNEAYLGVVQYKRREYRKGARTGEVLRKDGCHEPLVPPALWKAAQSSTTVQRSGTYAAGIAGGLLVCGSCGGRLAVAGSATNLTYGCRRQRNGGKCKAPVFVLKGRADEFVERQVLEALTAIEPARGDDGQLARLSEARDVAQHSFDTALERSLMLSDPARAQALLTRTESALDAAQDALDDATADADTIEGLLPSATHWSELSDDARRRVAGALIDRIVVGPCGVRGRRVGSVEDRFTVLVR